MAEIALQGIHTERRHISAVEYRRRMSLSNE